MKLSNNLAENGFALREPKVLVIGFGNPLRGDDGVGLKSGTWTYFVDTH